MKRARTTISASRQRGPSLEDSSDDSSDSGYDCKTYTSSLPFHVDLTSQTAYYSSFQAINCHSNQEINEEEIKLGDCVAIRVDESDVMGASEWSTFASQIYDVSNWNHNMYHAGYAPFECPWNPVEVVSIFRQYDAKEAKKLHKLISKNKSKYKTFSVSGSNDEYLQMEVRWLYRDYDIKKLKNKKQQDDNLKPISLTKKPMILEEVFESDHVDEFSAMIILGRIDLYDEKSITFDRGMEYVNQRRPFYSIPFQCSRFWSVSQNTFLAGSSLKNRVERGRMYSERLVRDGAIDRSLRQLLGCNRKKNTPDGETFLDTLKRASSSLCLSKVASNDRSNRLCGREKEYDQIKNFLRAAVSNKQGELSLFIAGPPGTGKTATVNAVINRLQNDRGKGTCPDFDFISVNALELKHPTDAYVVLWEKISGEQRSPLAAAKLLDLFFSNKKALTETTTNKIVMYTNNLLRSSPVIVLLVDEIDYLVTKKQDVLYSIFDWPNRKEASHKLCVVGISNTINFSENILLPKVASRLGSAKVCIYLYTYD